MISESVAVVSILQGGDHSTDPQTVCTRKAQRRLSESQSITDWQGMPLSTAGRWADRVSIGGNESYSCLFTMWEFRDWDRGAAAGI